MVYFESSECRWVAESKNKRSDRSKSDEQANQRNYKLMNLITISRRNNEPTGQAVDERTNERKKL